MDVDEGLLGGLQGLRVGELVIHAEATKLIEALIEVCVAGAESMATACTTARNLCVAVTYTDVRG